MPAWARRDEARTRERRKLKIFLDRRSWIGYRKNGEWYVRLYGRDKAAQWDRLFLLWDGRCKKCRKSKEKKRYKKGL